MSVDFELVGHSVAMRRFVFILTIGLVFSQGFARADEEVGSSLPGGLEARRVQRVVDGGTLVLDGGERPRPSTRRSPWIASARRPAPSPAGWPRGRRSTSSTREYGIAMQPVRADTESTRYSRVWPHSSHTTPPTRWRAVESVVR